ncbi:MAG: NAD kinase [Bacteroidetes bacterium]|nr:MAG: NAD kinase [Bacteroidota bacterium]RLD93728.1 MAG: NAD kinase [Bacteroidota bacterium]
MQVAVFGRNFPPYARENIATMFSKFNMLNVDVWVFEPLMDFLQKKAGLRPKIAGLFTSHKDLPEGLDFLFSLGGDGTFLETVNLVRDSGIPVLGVNIGRLGFLSYISQENMDESLESVFSGKYDIEERMLLKVEVPGVDLDDMAVALNDVRIYKTSGSLITIHVKINQEFLSAYWADGLLLSTPTGSTAYNLSVGGPIVVPESNSFVLSPIAPHNLTVRPLVLPDSAVLQLSVDTRDSQFQLAVDSRTTDLDVDATVTIRKAAYSLKMIRIENISFYSTLRNKLMWGADRRN